MKTLVTLILILSPPIIFSAERVALLIGCANYSDLHGLTTPVNDATALKSTLESPALGFECLPVVQDATLETFYEALDSFQAKAKDARVALIFYSGHGIEHDGVNYLIPVNAELNTATQLKTQALSVSAVMEALAKTNATAKLAILDCCRDNPFKITKSWTATKGVRDEVLKELGEAEIPQATLVCFATSAGRQAAAVLNESSTNSPFTQFLLKEIQTPGLSLRDVFENVHDSLETATEGRQVPAVKTDNALNRVFRQTVLVEADARVLPSEHPVVSKSAQLSLMPTSDPNPLPAKPSSPSRRNISIKTELGTAPPEAKEFRPGSRVAIICLEDKNSDISYVALIGVSSTGDLVDGNGYKVSSPEKLAAAANFYNLEAGKADYKGGSITPVFNTYSGDPSPDVILASDILKNASSFAVPAATVSDEEIVVEQAAGNVVFQNPIITTFPVELQNHNLKGKRVIAYIVSLEGDNEPSNHYTLLQQIDSKGKFLNLPQFCGAKDGAPNFNTGSLSPSSAYKHEGDLGELFIKSFNSKIVRDKLKTVFGDAIRLSTN